MQLKTADKAIDMIQGNFYEMYNVISHSAFLLFDNLSLFQWLYYFPCVIMTLKINVEIYLDRM